MIRFEKQLVIAIVALFGAVSGVTAQSVGEATATRTRSSAGELALVELVSGLRNPWAVAPLPDGSALITERPGRLFHLTSLEPGEGRLVEVAGVPRVEAVGQGGLLDIIPSPAFSADETVFFSYSVAVDGGAATRVARARLDRSAAAPRLVENRVLFTLNTAVGGGRHFGSRLAFDGEGRLYITIGDRGTPAEAQDPANHQGTVVRINPDGTVPADNPDLGAVGVFSYGHRNPQGLARNPWTGEIWLHEHGPRGGDEINIVRGGANYGWPRVTFGVAYSGREISEFTSMPGMQDPILHWTPSIAPSGMAFVESTRYRGWQGDLIVGALVQQHLRRVDLASDGQIVGQEELFRGFARFRDVRQAPDGYLYVLTDERSGGLYRIVP